MPNADSDEPVERLTQLVSTQLAPSKHSTTGVRAAHPAVQARCTLTQASDRRGRTWTGAAYSVGAGRYTLVHGRRSNVRHCGTGAGTTGASLPRGNRNKVTWKVANWFTGGHRRPYQPTGMHRPAGGGPSLTFHAKTWFTGGETAPPDHTMDCLVAVI